MKRLVTGLCLSATALLATGSWAAAHTLYPIDQDGLNLRTANSTSAPIRAILPPGQGVQVLGKEWSWYRVRTADGIEAWAAAWVSRVVFNDEEMVAVVNTEAAEVRTRAGADSPVLVRVGRTQRLPVKEDAAGWYKVTLADGRQGWLDSKQANLEKVEPPPPAPPAARKTASMAVTLAVPSAPLLAGRHPSYDWTDTVKAGEKLTYLDAAEGWVQVESARGRQGWLRGNQVRLSKPGADLARDYGYELDEDFWSIAMPTQTRVTTPPEGLRLRQMPGTAGTLIATLPAGTVLQVAGERDGWLQVKLGDGRQGWVAKEYTQPRPTQGPGPRIMSAAVRTPAPGVRTLELTGRLSGARVVPVTQPQPGITVVLPDAVARPAQLTLADGGLAALGVGPDGATLTLSGSSPSWQVLEQTAERLVVELRPALHGISRRTVGSTSVYSLQIAGHVTPRTVSAGQEAVVELPGAALKALPAAIAPYVTVEEKDRVLRVKVPSLLPHALKRGSDGNLELHLYQPGLAGKTVVVDAGHGGPDGGATNKALGVREKDVNLAVALQLRTLLEKQGARVLLTRATDAEAVPAAVRERPPAGVDAGHLDLWYRSDLANRSGADAFISIHANSGGTGNGTETYYCSLNLNASRSAELARLVQKELVLALGRKDRGVKDERFYVTRTAQPPAVLAEMAFLNDPVETKLLADPAVQQKVAAGLARALTQFFAPAPAAPPTPAKPPAPAPAKPPAPTPAPTPTPAR